MSPRRGTAARIWILAAILAALGILTLLLYFGMSEPETAEVTLPTPVPSGAADSPNGEEADLIRAEVSPETVRAVLRTLSQARVDSYSRHLRAESFWPDGGSVTEMDVYVRGTSQRLIVDGDGTERNILLMNGMTYIWYEDATRVYSGASSVGDAELWQRTEDYGTLLEDEDIVIVDAGYVPYGGENCVCAAYITPELGYERRLYVSVKSGLLMGAETWDGDRLVFRVTGYGLDITTPSDEYFAFPYVIG